MASERSSAHFTPPPSDPADSASDLVRQLLAHGNPDYEPPDEAPPPPSTPERAAYQSAIRQVLHRLPQHAAQIEAELRSAREDLSKLLMTERQHRSSVLATSPQAFRSPALVDLLIRESQRLLHCDLAEALDLARWAHEVALRQQADSSPDWTMTAIARATAHLANVERMRGSLAPAERMLDFALELFDRHGTGDVLVEAEILELTALLRISQRRLPEAEALLSMACGLYEECEAFERIGPALATKAAALAEVGELTDAIDTLEEALAQLEIEHSSPVCAWALQNQAYYLLQARQARDAAEVLTAVEAPVSGPAAPWLTARQRWLEMEVAAQSNPGAPRPRAELDRALAALGLPEDGRGPAALRLGRPWEGDEEIFPALHSAA